jgi:hypothetical protein
MPEPLVHPSLLFDFTISIRHFDPGGLPKPMKSSPKKRTGKSKSTISEPALDALYRLPDFNPLGGRARPGSVFAGWSESGISLKANFEGKKSTPRFVQERGGFSDGLRLWIDTRNSPNVHRAGRFCHCFHFFPGSPNPTDSASEPRGILDEIPRAREQPNPIARENLRVKTIFKGDGYQLSIFIPAECLTGYLPTEFDRIRLFYDLVDHELGTQSQSLSPELRYTEDPCLWIEARLVKS